MPLTPTQRAADALLRPSGTTLKAFVIERDDLGVPKTRIAQQLAEATDGAIDVTDQAIRDWIKQFRGDREAVA